MKALLFPVSTSILLFALLALPSCGSGGGGSGGGHSAACQGTTATTLGGNWHVTGTLVTLDDQISSVYVPNGLDDAVLHLEFGAVATEQGSVGPVCSAAYFVTSATLDTTSPTGNPSSLFAGAVSNEPLVPEGIFTLTSTPFYFPAGDVSVVVDPAGDLIQHSDSLFEYTVSFEVYAGQQVVAVVHDEPGIDDDGDGQVDEPDESDPSDEIDPDAELVCAGTMKLSFARGDAGLATEPAQVGLEIRGRLLDADGACAGRATLSYLVEERRIRFAVDGLDPARGTRRIEAPLWPDGGFDSARIAAGEQLRLSGALAADLVPEATLTITGLAGERTLRFAPAKEASTKPAAAQPDRR